MPELSARPGAMGRASADNSGWGSRQAAGAAFLAGIALLAMWRIIAGTQSGTHPNDFLTYRYAVEAGRAGVNIYHHDITGRMLTAPHGAHSQPFTYTPTAVVAVWPAAWFGWHTAWILWDAAAMLVLVWVLGKFIPAATRHRTLAVAGAVAVVSFDCIVTHNIRTGQINIFLMGLVVADLFRPDDSNFAKVVPRGALVGVASAIKLTPGLFLLFFLITRQWRLFRGGVLGAVGATLVGALVYPSLTATFLGGTVWTLHERVDTVDDPGDPGNNSLNGALHASGSVGSALAVPVVLVAMLLAMYAAYRVHGAGRSVDAWLIVGLAAPLVSPFSWIHHLVYVLPALTLLFFDRSGSRAARIRNRVGVALVSIALYWGPWSADRWLRADHSPWLVLPVVIMRECALLASIAGIAALCARPRVRPGRTRVSPEVGQLATP